MLALFRASSSPDVCRYRCASALKASLRRLCALSKHRAIASDQLPLFWEFVENIAVARAVGVDKAFIEAIDKKVDEMGRQQVVELALAYAIALPRRTFSAGGCREEVLARYFRMAVALDWLADSAAYGAVRLSDAAISQFTQMAAHMREFRGALRRRVDGALIKLWREMRENIRQVFAPSLYDDVIMSLTS